MVLIFPKLVFFTVTISGVCWNRFSNIYFVANGLTMRDVGDLKSIGFLLKAITHPLWGYVGDYCGVKRALLGSFIFAALTLWCLRTHLESVVGAHLDDMNNLTHEEMHAAAFGVVSFWRILRGAANAISPLTGAYVVQVLAADDVENEGYGRQRLFASLAWGAGAAVSGAMIDIFSLDTVLFNFTYIGCALNVVILALKRDRVSAPVTELSNSREACMNHARGTAGVWKLAFSRFGAQVVFYAFCMVLVDTLTPLEVLDFGPCANAINQIA